MHYFQNMVKTVSRHIATNTANMQGMFILEPNYSLE
ncbi:hypothetical protein KAOT1_17143 [Kordia algicida OT-1]|uniref:Uncharacterized protein n=1 Tax=Kordia algicida OT-1 TaxID=391587 RepID=A9DSB2_9FLAO|nr:hypothetical protein KAOT1_17143 [Kordia algicida OT-1]